MWVIIALMSSLFAVVAPHTARGSDLRIDAHAQVRTLVAGIQQIERIRAKTPAIALDGSCVDEKLAEARAGLQIAAVELTRLDQGQGDAADNEYSGRRLRLLVERSGELARAARVCATEELSSIDTTKVEVEISPSVPRGDPTLPPGEWSLPDRPPQR